jgi:hypothetical protein
VYRDSWEADCHAAGQASPRVLWTLLARYHVRNSPAPVFILSKMNPIPLCPILFPQESFKCCLSSTPINTKCCLPLKFTEQNVLLIFHLSRAWFMPRPFLPLLFWTSFRVRWRLQIVKLAVMQMTSLLGWCSVWSRRSWPTFQRCLRPPSSLVIALLMDTESPTHTTVNFYETTRRNIREGSSFSCLPPWEPQISLLM